ncbi:MAG TPA: hypothetical protein H9850_01475 [Candidatus Anaerobiospirillum pullistercoris]|uniref:Uncharacterized protein n=1 Tax=Candidatus Anaerobiospirillum pullistercoris TaxID=2838452 RepID=A0A9D2B0P5_9GAMM|nr:hypothetical protein [Candidatus Anaerobiospirillum pullistercoris]
MLDNFTYGATLGVAAKTGNFSLDVNYTGPSNVDEFGVQANARFVCKALTIENKHRCMSSFTKTAPKPASQQCFDTTVAFSIRKPANACF